jgi:type I restriction enzyme, S subunit
MKERILNNLEIWTTAQTVKSNVRSAGIDNQKHYGIEKMRELILELAVSGKLVPQDPNDEPTSVLLKKIAKEKEGLVNEGKIKNAEKLVEIKDEEIPFQIPEKWQWSKLGSLGIGSTGKTPSTNNPSYYIGDIEFIGPGQISTDGKIIKSDKNLSSLGCKYSTVSEPGDILMVCIGGSIGKSAIARKKIAFNQQINCIRPIMINSSFLYITINSSFFQATLISKSTGSATPIINRSKW